MIKKAFFIWIVLQYPAWLSAQAVLVDTTFISHAELNVLAIYADRMVDQIHLYEGANYIPYQRRNDQHP